ncbi:MAG: hydrogenase expression/formation protein HypE [Ruminiclostridium sp.]|nr:hydrogenase expression/formation protein HypE [Ruminiclostridium sp.]
MGDEKILLSHGSGGKMMHDLISGMIKQYFSNPILDKLNDFAEVEGAGKIAISTDSFVVKPYKFPGGDIGKLAVCGTVNDVAVSGAEVLYLTLGFIIEEGFSMKDFNDICRSIKRTADEAGVIIITGDTKVVEKGAADGIYINTTGIGIKRKYYNIGAEFVRPGDKVIVTGMIGEHGIAILNSREGLSFNTNLVSDCAPLNGMIKELLEACSTVKCMRDPTRGGVATTLNEIARQSSVKINIFEENIPINPAVQGVCDLLGFDPLYVANEGKLLIFLSADEEQKAIEVLRRNKYGKDSAVIGKVIEGSPRVNIRTILGSHRIVDELVTEQLPRIC